MHYLRALLVTVLYIIAIEMIGLWALLVYGTELDIMFIGYYGIIDSCLILLLVLLFLRVRRRRFPSITFFASFKWYLVAVFLGVVFVLFQTPLNWFYDAISGASHHIRYEFQGFDILSRIGVWATILIGPISEELIFRQYIQGSLQKKSKPIVAILVTAVLFAAIHIPLSPIIWGYGTVYIHHAFITFFGGLALGWLFYKSKSIGPAIAMHIAWNLTVVLF